MSPTPGRVYLAASSHEGTLRELAARILAAHGRRPLHVAATYAAAGGPMVSRTNAFLGHLFPGATVERFTVAGEAGSVPPDDARAVLERADLVFVSGGDPVRGARLLAAAGADLWLREAHARGAACFGISAGSIMLCAWWADWPESPSPGAPHDGGTLVPCAAVLPDLVVDCHAEEDGWAELRLVRGMLAARGGALPKLLGLPSGSAVVVEPGGAIAGVGGAPFSF